MEAGRGANDDRLPGANREVEEIALRMARQVSADTLFLLGIEIQNASSIEQFREAIKFARDLKSAQDERKSEFNRRMIEQILAAFFGAAAIVGTYLAAHFWGPK